MYKQNVIEAEKKISAIESSQIFLSEAHIKQVNELQERMLETIDHTDELHRRKLSEAVLNVDTLESKVKELESKRPKLIGGDG